jgi:hypothetical protein
LLSRFMALASGRCHDVKSVEFGVLSAIFDIWDCRVANADGDSTFLVGAAMRDLNATTKVDVIGLCLHAAIALLDQAVSGGVPTVLPVACSSRHAFRTNESAGEKRRCSLCGQRCSAPCALFRSCRSCNIDICVACACFRESSSPLSVGQTRSSQSMFETFTDLVDDLAVELNITAPPLSLSVRGTLLFKSSKRLAPDGDLALSEERDLEPKKWSTEVEKALSFLSSTAPQVVVSSTSLADAARCMAFSGLLVKLPGGVRAVSATEYEISLRRFKAVVGLVPNFTPSDIYVTDGDEAGMHLVDVAQLLGWNGASAT